MENKVIAFYLPQYHPTPHNNEWWGEGFTEWTNVAKAKPLFKGHYQPKVPADLGFYDLRLPESRQKQAELAKEAGVYGFCYYHYWFGDGKEELDLPFKEVVESGKPDFPFCLCWANESWYKKLWNKDNTMKEGSKILVEQKYLGKEDNEKHFYTLLNAFKDKRYIRIKGKPLFMIYKPLQFTDMSEFIQQWNSLALVNGLPGFHFVGFTFDVDTEYDKIKNLGFDSVCSCRVNGEVNRGIRWACRKLWSIVSHKPRCEDYKDVIKRLITNKEKSDDIYPTIMPNWDHTPRSGYNGGVWTNSTPVLFKKHVLETLDIVKNKKNEDKIIFLKSWNEWGEGNYMEPDLRYGKGFMEALKSALNEFDNEK